MFSLKVDNEIELKLAQAKYAVNAFEVIKANYDHLQEWMLWVNESMSFETVPDFYKNSAKSFKEDGTELGLLIFYQGKIIGGTGLHSIIKPYKSAEIGYWLAKEFNGRGIVTKSVMRLLEYVFEEKNLNRITIRCVTENLKSLAIPERPGFTKEGIERESVRLHTRFADQIIYSMLAKEWKKTLKK
jgi:ribosomal-protein-serine acetyltransferase